MTIPARSAASGTVTSEIDFPEEELGRRFDAVGSVAEVDDVEVGLENLLFVYFRSIWMAHKSSLNFRDQVRSFVRKASLASCWVMVLPPWRRPPGVRLAMAAPAIPEKSIP